MIVYLVTNNINGKYYVGKTIGKLKYRWSSHKTDARRKNQPLYGAIRKYGSENFSVSELAKADSRNALNELEKLWVISLRSYDREIRKD